MEIISTGNSITFEYHAHDCKLKHATTNHLNFYSSMLALLALKVANSCEIFAVWVFIDRLTPAGSTWAHWKHQENVSFAFYFFEYFFFEFFKLTFPKPFLRG